MRESMEFAVQKIQRSGVHMLVSELLIHAQGASNPNGQWKFIITGTFTTSPGSAIQHVNGAQACNTYFIVQSSASMYVVRLSEITLRHSFP